MAEFGDPPSVWRPFGAFSQLAWPGQGQLLFLKGQVALDRAGAIVGRGDMDAQVRQVLENIRLLLDAVGGRMADVLALTQHTTDIDAFLMTGALRRSYFQPPYPVTTTVQVVRLYDPALLVEITAVAEVPSNSFHPPSGESHA